MNDFRTSSEYFEWNQLAAELTEGSGKVEELCGLESWFTLPGQPLQPLPQWKMALATYFGVVPVTIFLALTLGRSGVPVAHQHVRGCQEHKCIEPSHNRYAGFFGVGCDCFAF